MDPIEFLNLAKELNSGTTQSPAVEPKLRTAVSRAYYYVFLKIQQTLTKLGQPFYKGRDTHKQVIDCLYMDISTSPIAIRLDSLRKKRNEADYDIDSSSYLYGTDKATVAISEAELLSNDFESIDKNNLIGKIRNVP